MHPTLLAWKTGISWLGTIEITSYSVAMAVGFIVGTVLLWRWARREEIDTRDATDLAIWMVVFGLVGAKLLHVVADGYLMEYVYACVDPSQVSWDKWRVSAAYCRELGGNAVRDAAGAYAGCVPTERNCLGWINLFAGGYTFYGGLLAAGAAAFVLARRRGLPLWRTVDTLMWIVMLGLGLGRIGCFLNGCCFGRATGSWIGVVFPQGSPAWVQHGRQGLIGPSDAPLPIVPTQLVEAAFVFALAAFLRFVVEPRRRYEGQVFTVGLAAYAVGRIVLETFRADPRGAVLGISTSQIVAALALAGAFVLHRRLAARPDAAG